MILRNSLFEFIVSLPLKLCTYLSYYLVFLLFSAYQHLENVYQQWFCQSYLANHTQHNIRYLQENVKEFKKMPQHMGIIFEIKETNLLSEVDFMSIAKIICWCIGSGIQFISLYDMNGIIKSHTEDLQQSIQQMKSQFFGEKSKNYCVVLSSNSDDTCYLKEKKSNGKQERCEKVEDIFVRLISYTDGRPNIINATKSIAHQVLQGNIRANEISSTTLSTHITKIFPTQNEPDLILCFHQKTKRKQYSPSPLTLDGYLPWHIRLTEILQIPMDYEKCHVDCFLDALASYTKTDRRHGV
eukprot:TRINITY_DN1865_c0_g1_i1.p1 TRINITY_DN1865_c0_g1~~TRINITY_DN1865_c0_g1_i1.p1  ORF type:complete len:298 (-),score=55.99 TRINITY_DN1865_c0_g1_i1:65-958(-)